MIPPRSAPTHLADEQSTEQTRARERLFWLMDVFDQRMRARMTQLKAAAPMQSVDQIGADEQE